LHLGMQSLPHPSDLFIGEQIHQLNNNDDDEIY
jgi:hypothetical protein